MPTKGAYAWQDPVIAKQRLESTLGHQNRIREAMGVPKLSLLTEKNGYAAPVRGDGDNIPFWVEVAGFPDQPIIGLFQISGDLLIRRVENDLFSLNYVYGFKGSRSEEPTPFAYWSLKQEPSSEIVLYRKMSPEEFKLWEAGRFEEIGRNWGHQTSTGGETRVVHFSTARDFTTAAAPNSYPTIEIRAPREILLYWAKEPGHIWAGALKENATVLEYVLSAALVKHLFESGALSHVKK